MTAVKGGTPQEGIEVTASSEHGGGSGSETTKAGGKYEITGLSAGEYKVRFHDPKAKYIDQFKTIFLAEGKNTLDTAMQEPGTISGRVTSAATGSGLGNINVYVYELTGTGEEEERSATTNANGEYTLTDLPPGEYTVDFYSYESGYLSQSTTTTVGEDEVDTVNAALKEGGKISGRVTDAVAHNGLAKIGVRAFSSNPESEAYSNGYAETNANGEYTVTGLQNGSIRLSSIGNIPKPNARHAKKNTSLCTQRSAQPNTSRSTSTTSPRKWPPIL